MDVPEWVWDELRPRTRGTAGLLVALAIFRYGGGARAEAFPNEGIAHRARVNATMRQLAGMAGVSPRAAEGGVKELVELGFLEASRPQKPGAPRSFYLAYQRPDHDSGAHYSPAAMERPADFADRTTEGEKEHAKFARGKADGPDRCAESAHSPDSSRVRANCGGDDSSQIRDRRGKMISTSNSLPVPREQILRALRAIGVDSLSSLEAKYRMDNIFGALRVLHRTMAETDIENPAGYLVRTLEKWPVFDVPEDGSFLNDLCDPERMTSLRRMTRYGGRQRDGKVSDWGFGAGAST